MWGPRTAIVIVLSILGFDLLSLLQDIYQTHCQWTKGNVEQTIGESLTSTQTEGFVNLILFFFFLFLRLQLKREHLYTRE